MVVKELGNLTPYVRNKGALPRKRRAQRKGPGLDLGVATILYGLWLLYMLAFRG
jgi:hypothetical protein